VLSRVIWGAHASLLPGLVSVCISMAPGVPIGLLAAYAGGWTDGLISRFTDAMLAVPCRSGFWPLRLRRSRVPV
jgi:peptide/nickel transport system permease protein